MILRKSVKPLQMLYDVLNRVAVDATISAKRSYQRTEDKHACEAKHQ
ncbi:MAG: hypothetical protein QJT81_03020 [Candidatus Thiothrix putei]|uniref:Uncharacterized protein n=1 Tax=Candidatus Thiothrix putei TaxID=3080811 RepID=A0AA95HCW8_9GAMM|nr:MAG: hypothetical protein QJT81_03020 [Candidatus Thiothrix putei]